VVWRYLVGGLFALHGLIHAIGFSATWRLGQATVVSATPTYPSGLGEGTSAVRVLGVLWVVAMVAFLAAAVGVVTVAPWWKGLAAGAAVLSLLLCLAWWNDAKAGVVIDLLILVGLVIATWVVRPAVA
jgi:hypothetical protein